LFNNGNLCSDRDCPPHKLAGNDKDKTKVLPRSGDEIEADFDERDSR
jgi:hypothetical protein